MILLFKIEWKNTSLKQEKNIYQLLKYLDTETLNAFQLVKNKTSVHHGIIPEIESLSLEILKKKIRQGQLKLNGHTEYFICHLTLTKTL